MYCQQLLSVVKLGGVCVPFGHKVKACTCSETYICIGYVLPTIVDVHLYWIYSANNCGVLFRWGLSVCPSSTRLGHLHVLRYIFVLDMFCQQLWGVVRLRVVHLYWIYSANNCGCTFVLDIFCQQLWSIVQMGAVCVPFKHKVGAFTCFEIYICIGYVLPTIVGCCSFKGCTFVLDIFCQQL